METIKLFTRDGHWMAKFSDKKTIEAFGTDEIPTAFTASTPKDQVLNEIAAKNPNCKVEIDLAVIMEHTFSRMSEYKNGRIGGAFSPISAGRAVAESAYETLIAVYRINFNKDGYHNQRMYQEYERGEGYTGYDHLLICFPHWVIFSVDRGSSIESVAACFGHNKGDIKIHANHSKYSQTLSDEELSELVTTGWDIAMEYKKQLIKEQEEHVDNVFEPQNGAYTD